MTTSLTLTGFPELNRTLTKIGDRDLALKAAGAGMISSAHRVLNRSQDLVPVDFGVLRASGRAVGPVISGRGVAVAVGYGGAASKYAVLVHENPRSGNTQGLSPSGKRYKHWAATGQWKYLEQAVKEAASYFWRDTNDSVRAWLRAITR